jgi:hypothetical protein
MTKTFCDRCGAEIAEFEQAEVSITTYDGDGEIDASTSLELCPACIIKVYEATDASK